MGKRTDDIPLTSLSLNDKLSDTALPSMLGKGHCGKVWGWNCILVLSTTEGIFHFEWRHANSGARNSVAIMTSHSLIASVSTICTSVCDISWSSCFNFIARKIGLVSCYSSVCDLPNVFIKLDTCSPGATPKKFIPALSTMFLSVSDRCTVREQTVTLCPLRTSSSPSAVEGDRCPENGGANIRIDRRRPSASPWSCEGEGADNHDENHT